MPNSNNGWADLVVLYHADLCCAVLCQALLATDRQTDSNIYLVLIRLMASHLNANSLGVRLAVSVGILLFPRVSLVKGLKLLCYDCYINTHGGRPLPSDRGSYTTTTHLADKVADRVTTNVRFSDENLL